MNIKDHSDYFKSCAQYLNQKWYIIALITIIDSYIIMIHLSQAFSIFFSYQSKEYIFLQGSPLYYFRILKIPFQSSSLEMYHYSLNIIVIILYLTILILKQVIASTNPIIQTIIVNLNELFLLRFLHLFALDIIITTIDTFLNITTGVYKLISIGFMIILLIHLYYCWRNFSLYQVFFYSVIPYPFDAFSAEYDIIQLCVKVLIAIEGCQVKISQLTLTAILLALIYIGSSMLFIYQMYFKSCYFMHNIMLNKIRLFLHFILLTISFTFTIYESHTFICVLSSIIIVIFITVSINIYSFHHRISFKLNDLHQTIILLLKDIYINDKSDLIKYNEAMSKHYNICQRCVLCLKINHKKYNNSPMSMQTFLSIFKLLNDLNKNQKDLIEFFNMFNQRIYSLSTINPKTKIQTAMTDEMKTEYSLMVQINQLISKYSKKNINITINLELINLLIFNQKICDKDSNNMSHSTEMSTNAQLNYIWQFCSEITNIFQSILDLCTLNMHKLSEYHTISTMVLHFKHTKYKGLFFFKDIGFHYTGYLITIIYEELFNMTLTPECRKRDSFGDYEDQLTFHYENDNSIVFIVDFITWKSPIIQIGKELNKHTNKNFSELFPNVLSKYQMKSFKKNINKQCNEMDYFIESYDSQEKEIKESFNFKVYTALHLEGKFLPYLSQLNSLLYIGNFNLNQYHFIITKSSKDIIIGISKSLYEILAKSVKYIDSDYSSLEQIMKKMHLTRNQLNKSKIINDNGVTYTFYLVNLSLIQTISPETVIIVNTKKSLPQFDIKNFINDTTSVFLSLKSTPSSSGSFNHFFQLKGIHGQKTEKRKSVLSFKLSIFILCLLTIIYTIIAIIFDVNALNDLIKKYQIQMQLRSACRLYLISVSSLMANICVGHVETGLCSNYLNDYNLRFNKKYSQSLNFTEFINLENHIKLDHIVAKLKDLKSDLFSFNDPTINKEFEKEIEYHQVTIDNGILISYEIKNAFLDVMQLFSNSLAFIFETQDYMKDPIFLINTYPKIEFGHVAHPKELKAWQKEYYTIIINFFNLLLRWFFLQTTVSDYITSKVKDMEFLFFITGTIAYLLLFLLVLLILSLIMRFANKQEVNYNKIQYKLYDESFIQLFRRKISLLQTMTLLYKQSPVSLLHSLEDTYREGLHIRANRVHESNKSFKIKRVNSDLSIIHYKGIDTPIKLFTRKDVMGLLKNWLTIIIISTSYLLILYIIIMFSISDSIGKMLLTFKLIQDRAYADATILADFGLLQLMHLCNLTQEQVSIIASGNDSFYYADDLLEANKMLTYVIGDVQEIVYLFPDIVSIFPFQCDIFHDRLNDSIINVLNKEYPNKQYNKKLGEVCEVLGIFLFEESSVFYNSFVNRMLEQILTFKNVNYHNIELKFEQNDLHEAYIINDFFFRPLRTGANNSILQIAIDNIKRFVTNILYVFVSLAIFNDLMAIIVMTLLIHHMKRRNLTTKAFVKVFEISDKDQVN